MAPPDRHRQRGLTLVESLVALAVTGLLATLALEGVAAARRLTESAGRQAAVAERIEGAQIALRRQIAAAFPAARKADGKIFVDFDGTAARLDFTAPAPLAEGPGVLRRQRLALDGAGALVLAAGDRQDVLVDRVARLDLAYADAAGRWYGEWRGRPELPALVSVTLQFPAGDTRWWPLLLVHPAVGLDSGCVLADAGAACAGR